LGASKSALTQNPEFTPGAEFTTEDYYVWTRCDGGTSMRDIVLMVGFGTDKGVAILQKLHKLGAVMKDGETPASIAKRIEDDKNKLRTRPKTEPMIRTTRAGTMSDLDGQNEQLGDLDAEELVAMAEDVALSDTEKFRVIQYRRRVRHGTYFDMLGVEPEARKKELKRAYFRVSKAFHPDRFYKKETGSFGPWLTEIFEFASRAFTILSDDRQRRQYEAQLRGETVGGQGGRPQTPEEHAADLFDRACKHEVAGQLDEAMKLFGASVRVDPKPRYMRRAASCGIKAGELVSAEQYAKKAAEMEPDDPSTARVLASAYKAADKLEEAERTLLAALELKTENDSLLRGLKSDLEAVQKARTAQ
jgi:tetratricopeptide (TPR) repeat protein